MVIKEGGFNVKDDILIDIQDWLRDEEIESRKKTYQEQKLQLIIG
jgi:hypothetical protein